MEEMQNKKTAEMEERIAGRIQQFVNQGTENLQSLMQQQMKGYTEKLEAGVEVSKASIGTEQSKLDDLSLMIKNIGQDCSKHVEVGIGVFGNSLRSQLETMQSAQLQQRLETENNLTNKLDLMANHVHQVVERCSNQQTEKINVVLEPIPTNLDKMKDSAEKAAQSQLDGLQSFQRCVEDASKRQHDKTQDMHSMLASVLEQTIGAKDRSTECSDKVSLLHQFLGGGDKSGLASPGVRPMSAMSGGGVSGGGVPDVSRRIQGTPPASNNSNQSFQFGVPSTSR
jgi:hypothetical protein